MSSTPSTPSEELRALRTEAGLKSGELARQIGVAPVTLSRYENGKAEVPMPVLLATRYVCEKKVIGASPAAERLVAAMKEALNDAG